MTNLSEIKPMFEKDANLIADWKKKTVTELANGYCDVENKDESLRSSYFSALMCKYWYMLPYLYAKNKTLKLDMSDYLNWLEEALLKGLKYRRWRDARYGVSKLENGAKVVFNGCLTSIEKMNYYLSNASSRKIRHITESLDGLKDELAVELRLNNNFSKYYTIEDSTNSLDSSYFVIKYFLDNKKYLEAIVTECIISQDCIGNSNVIKYSDIYRILKECPIAEYLSETYSADKEELQKCVDSITKLTCHNSYWLLSRAVYVIKNSEEVKKILCY